MFQHHWLQLGNWAPDDWTLNFAVFDHGRIVGQQAISARNFATLHEVGTGSWIGLRHQGRGIGTEMRAAVLHLAFAGLQATDAVSGAFADNPSSFRVSEKLGYEADGIQRLAVREKITVMRRVRVSRRDGRATSEQPSRSTDSPLPTPARRRVNRLRATGWIVGRSKASAPRK